MSRRRLLMNKNAPSGSEISGGYSLRNLGLGATNLVEVERFFDNATKDFSAIEITNGDLVVWVGTGDARVNIIYDQSVNGRHLFLDGILNDNLIVQTGNLIVNTDNGLPAINFRSCYFEHNVLEENADVTLISVYKEDLTAKRIFGVRGLSGTLKETLAQVTDNSIRYDGDASIGLIAFNTDTKIRFTEKTNSSALDFINNIENINQSIVLPNTRGYINIGLPRTTLAGSSSFIGLWQESIIWYSQQSTNRIGIQTEINNYYNTY